MWEVAWRPVPVSAFPETDVTVANPSQGAVGGGSKGGMRAVWYLRVKLGLPVFFIAVPQKPQPAAYVPPHLRGQTNRPQFKLHDDDEPASNVKEQQQNLDGKRRMLDLVHGILIWIIMISSPS